MLTFPFHLRPYQLGRAELVWFKDLGLFRQALTFLNLQFKFQFCLGQDPITFHIFKSIEWEFCRQRGQSSSTGKEILWLAAIVFSLRLDSIMFF